MLLQLLADAQTSGGLLMSVSPASLHDLLDDLSSTGVESWVIGEITDDDAGTISITR